MLLVSKEKKILWANDNFLNLVGKKSEEVIGRNCRDIGISDLCCSDCKNSDHEICESILHFNVKVSGADVNSSFCLIRSPFYVEGELIGFLESFRNMDPLMDMIMGLKKVEEAIRRERDQREAILNKLADGVFVVDKELKISYLSKSMETMLGVSSKDVIGEYCRNVLKGSLCDTDCPLKWSLENKATVSGCRDSIVNGRGKRISVEIRTGLYGDPEQSEKLFGVVIQKIDPVQQLRKEECGSFEDIVGRSSVMCHICSKLKAVAETDATVLLTGESGTGKELAARGLHKHSTRPDGPFISVNCAALADTLLESELFGHIKGAFTGAIKDRQGRFELAHGGTLFLDEIGDMSPSLQAKVLRAIEEKTVQPLGSEKEIKVDVRIIAATNKDLSEEVKKGNFREDLFYRLNVFPVELPPLRMHKEDIPFLVNFFISKYVKTHFRGDEKDFQGISERAMATMIDYNWPGNVRELENAVEYAMVSTDKNRIERKFLPPLIVAFHEKESSFFPSVPDDDSQRCLGEEFSVISAALESNKWSISKTAVKLRMSRTTLWRKMKQLGINK